MTVIVAYPDRILSDSRVTTGEAYYNAQKIFRIRDELVAVAGGNRSAEKFLRWYKGSRRQPLDLLHTKEDEGGDEFDAVVVNKRGIWAYSTCGLGDLVYDPFHGVGTGWAAAKAALLAGSDARQAIEIACLVHPGCGLPIQELLL